MKGVFLEIKPFSLDDLNVMMAEMERMLTKLAGSTVYVQGWEKDPVTGKKKTVPRESLESMKGKHHCYHQGKWVDRDPLNDPIPTPNSDFGVAYMAFDDLNQIDHAAKEIDGTGYANSVIHAQKVEKDTMDMDLQG